MVAEGLSCHQSINRRVPPWLGACPPGVCVPRGPAVPPSSPQGPGGTRWAPLRAQRHRRSPRAPHGAFFPPRPHKPGVFWWVRHGAKAPRCPVCLRRPATGHGAAPLPPVLPPLQGLQAPFGTPPSRRTTGQELWQPPGRPSPRVRTRYELRGGDACLLSFSGQGQAGRQPQRRHTRCCRPEQICEEGGKLPSPMWYCHAGHE